LAEIWSQLLRIQQIGLRDSFFDLGGDSLLTMKLMGRVNKGFGISLPVTVAFQARTIEQMAAAIDRELQRTPPSRSDTQAPLLFCLSYGPTIAEYLGHAFAVHELRECIEDKVQSFKMLETLAAYLVGRIRAIQAEGPYNLCGSSAMAVVAFEIALQLRAQNQTVNSLIMILPTPLDANTRGFLVRRVVAALREIWCRSCTEWPSFVAGKWRVFRKRLFVQYSNQAIGQQTEDVPLHIYLRRLVYRYKPQAYDSKMVALVSEDERPYMRVWQRFSRQTIEVQEIPGDHSTALNPLATVNCATAFAKLRECLERATGNA
jgi:thioesterase domain-containing protein/acyl carrier protein